MYQELMKNRSKRTPWVWALVAFAVLAVPNALAAQDVVEKTSPHDFATTVQNLKRQVSAVNLVVVQEIPIQGMLRMAGLSDVGGAVTLEIFHPRYGRMLWGADKNAFLAVPLRIIVQERGRSVTVAYLSASDALADYNVPRNLKTELDGLLTQIVDNALQQ